MITAERFLVRSAEHDRWIHARSQGVTATEVAGAASGPAGFRDALAARAEYIPIEVNNYMQFGTDSEAEIMRTAHEGFGILPSDWLISAADDPTHLATPDGISLDHRQIAEAKTTGKDWKTPPIKYRRQIQWQLHVSGAGACLLLWQLRSENTAGGFFLGWVEPKTMWIERDEEMIADLIQVANRLQEESV